MKVKQMQLMIVASLAHAATVACGTHNFSAKAPTRSSASTEKTSQSNIASEATSEADKERNIPPQQTTDQEKINSQQIHQTPIPPEPQDPPIDSRLASKLSESITVALAVPTTTLSCSAILETEPLLQVSKFGKSALDLVHLGSLVWSANNTDVLELSPDRKFFKVIGYGQSEVLVKGKFIDGSEFETKSTVTVDASTVPPLEVKQLPINQTKPANANIDAAGRVLSTSNGSAIKPWQLLSTSKSFRVGTVQTVQHSRDFLNLRYSFDPEPEKNKSSCRWLINVTLEFDFRWVGQSVNYIDQITTMSFTGVEPANQNMQLRSSWEATLRPQTFNPAAAMLRAVGTQGFASPPN